MLFAFGMMAEYGHLLAPNRVFALGRGISLLLSLQHFGWFASGAGFYEYTKSRDGRVLFASFAIALANSLTVAVSSEEGPWPPLLFAIGITCVFGGAVWNVRIQRTISFPVLLFFGFVSYPLYLIHENMLISLVVKVGRLGGPMPGWGLPLVSLGVVLALSYGIARFFEVPLKRAIQGAGRMIMVRVSPPS